MRNTVNFNGAIEAIKQGAINGIKNEFIPFIMPIIRERTPEDTGALRNSERAEVYESEGKIKLDISANTPYAMYQHEIPNYMHKTGESGFILNPLNENSDEFVRCVSKGINESLRNGGR